MNQLSAAVFNFAAIISLTLTAAVVGAAAAAMGRRLTPGVQALTAFPIIAVGSAVLGGWLFVTTAGRELRLILFGPGVGGGDESAWLAAAGACGLVLALSAAATLSVSMWDRLRRYGFTAMVRAGASMFPPAAAAIFLAYLLARHASGSDADPLDLSRRADAEWVGRILWWAAVGVLGGGVGRVLAMRERVERWLAAAAAAGPSLLAVLLAVLGFLLAGGVDGPLEDRKSVV